MLNASPGLPDPIFRCPLRSILARMLRRNNMAALELHRPAAALPAGAPAGLVPFDDPRRQQAEDELSNIIAMRDGDVLGESLRLSLCSK